MPNAKTRRLSALSILILLCLAAAPARAQLPPDFPGLSVLTCDTNAVGDGLIFLEVTDTSTNAGFYVMILKNDGTPVWYRNVTNHNYDFKVLPNGYLHYADIYHTHSWTGGGDCTHEILDGDYQWQESITAGNGYVADAHVFQLLPNGHILLEGYYRTRMDVSKYVVGGYPNALVAGAVIQELDAQRKVVFQWRTWDHFTIPTYFPPTAFTNAAAKNPVIDAFHLNSVVLDTDGNLLVSNFGMDVWKISRQTGAILWRLGGPGNQFSFVNETPQQALGHFSGHTLTRLENGNLLIYCNADQAATRASKVYEYQLDEIKKTAKLIWSYAPPTNYYAWHYGSAQRLANGNTFIGWGGANIMPGIGGITNQWIPACTEVTPEGKVAFELRFNDPKIASYRAFRFVYPPASQVISSSVFEPANDNTYDFDTTGASITLFDGGGGYTALTLNREPYAPVNPQFQGKAPRVLPLRVSLADAGIYSLTAQLDFDAASFGFTDPANLTVYYRLQTGQGVFQPLTTVYNPVSKKLLVTLTMTSPDYDLGEFVFGYPDVADLALPPLLAQVENYLGVQTQEVIGPLPAVPGEVDTVNQELPILLSWSPQGLTHTYQLQIDTHSDFSAPLVNLASQTEAFFVWSDAVPGSTYYYRVSTSNEAGTSAWAVGSFETVAPGIVLLTPNGGEAWQRGLKYFVRWQGNTPDPVVIDLYKGGLFVQTLATTANTGAYAWLVDPSLVPGADYTITTTSATDEGLSATSRGTFALDVPTITRVLQCPTGALALEWGGTSARVYVEYSPALSSDQWQEVAGPLSGSTWTNASTAAPEGFYRLRLQ